MCLVTLMIMDLMARHGGLYCTVLYCTGTDLMAGVLAGEVCGESRRWLMGEQDLADTESETSPDTAFCHTHSQTLELSTILLQVL